MIDSITVKNPTSHIDDLIRDDKGSWQSATNEPGRLMEEDDIKQIRFGGKFELKNGTELREGLINNKSKLSVQTLATLSPSGYTLPFIQRKTQEFIVKIRQAIFDWSETDTENALIHVKNVKVFTDFYSKYLDLNDESRLLVGTLQLIFDNDIWDNLTKQQLKAIYSELARFDNGDVNRQNLTIFTKQLYRYGINPLS